MIPDTLQRLRVAIGDLGIEVPADLETVSDPIACATLLGVVRELRNELYTIEQYIELRTAERMDKPALEWDGGRAVRRRTSVRVHWNNDDLASAVAVKAMVNTETGELPSEEAQAVGSAVKAAIVKCAGFSYWRVGELEAIAIDADDYRKRERGRYVIEVDLADGEAA